MDTRWQCHFRSMVWILCLGHIKDSDLLFLFSLCGWYKYCAFLFLFLFPFMHVIMHFANFADTVRGLAVVPDVGVLSASHDGFVSNPQYFIIYSA